MYIISKTTPQNTRESPEATPLQSFSRPPHSFPRQSFNPQHPSFKPRRPSFKPRATPKRKSVQRPWSTSKRPNRPYRPRRVTFILPERPTPPHVLANLYIPLLVNAKSISILSSPNGTLKAHVHALRVVLQTYSDERQFIVNAKDAACKVCVKRLRNMNWIRRTYRKRSLRLRLKLFNRNVRKGRARELQLRCGHEHRLKEFSDRILPSNCARIHNLLIKTGPDLRLDPFVFRSVVTNIHSYLPNLKQITLQHIPREKHRSSPISPSNPSPPIRVNHVREMQTFSPAGSVSLVSRAISLPHGGTQGKIAAGRRQTLTETSTETMSLEYDDRISRRDKREYLECFKILEQQLPHGKRLQFKGMELYPGITKQWRKQRRKWYE